jgi:hypothetical protein
MIKMKAGTFGGRINGKLTAITPEYGPFSTDEATEERLVKAGVAEYVDAPAGGKTDGKKPEPPAGLDALSYADLQKLAREKGLDPNGKKPELIARIEAAENAPKEPEDKGDETPPSFDPAKTVV